MREKLLCYTTGSKTDTLYPLFVGQERCLAGHRYGPHIRDYYLIHFCLSGKGRLEDRHGTHEIGEGELFVIRPNEITIYEADEKEPWHYTWIAFDGERARIFDDAPSVMAYPSGLPERMVRYIERDETASEIYLSILYELFYRLFCHGAESDGKSDVGQVCRYIRYHYMNDLSVAALALTFGYDRSHLYRIFKTQIGVGVKEYVTRVRMEKAQEFLCEGYTVAQTAHMVGFDDPFHFSKSYKKHFGIAPLYAKKKNAKAK